MSTRSLRISTPGADLSYRLPGYLAAVVDRFRQGGAFVLLLEGGGAVGWHDQSAAPFFLRYVLPLIQSTERSARAAVTVPRMEGGGDAITESSLVDASAPYGAAIWRSLPGVMMAGFPYYERKQRLGIVAVAARSPAFTLNDETLLACSRIGLDPQWLAAQAADLPAYGDEAIVRNARLLNAALRDLSRVATLESELQSITQQLANTYEELNLIYQISSGMKVNRRASEFFKQSCLDVLDVLSVRGMGVALHHDLHDRPEPVLYGPLSLPPVLVQQLSDQLMFVLHQRKSALMVDDLSADPTFGWVGEHAHQLLAVPLQRGEQVLGCLFALDKVGGVFDSVDSKLLNSIANESAIYLENALLFEDVHGLMMGLLHSLTSAVDAKDAYTCGHSERVALLSRYLAQEVGLDDHEVEQVYMAGLLHDVGKIGVPEDVLQKTGRLTLEEFEKMKQHPGIGARILADVKQLKPILPGVLHHHERYDGKGYPAGLAGRAIPLMGRIICLADCFDAMTSNRTYRKALPLQVAMSEIRRCAGTQFDPQLAEAFLHASPEGLRELLRNHQEKSKRLLDLQETLRTTKAA